MGMWHLSNLKNKSTNHQCVCVCGMTKKWPWSCFKLDPPAARESHRKAGSAAWPWTLDLSGNCNSRRSTWYGLLRFGLSGSPLATGRSILYWVCNLQGEDVEPVEMGHWVLGCPKTRSYLYPIQDYTAKRDCLIVLGLLVEATTYLHRSKNMVTEFEKHKFSVSLDPSPIHSWKRHGPAGWPISRPRRVQLHW